MISKDGICYRNMKDGQARDDTSGKKRLYKNFIYNEFTFTYASSYIEKMDRNVKLYKNFIYNEFTFTYASSYIEKMNRTVKKYSSHILRYMNIY